MIKFKSCPRCSQGDLILDQDIYGSYMQCIQCAHIVEMVSTPAKQELPMQRVAILPAAA